MNADSFRKIALGFPDAVEFEHRAHPDFRVCGKKYLRRSAMMMNGAWSN